MERSTSLLAHARKLDQAEAPVVEAIGRHLADDVTYRHDIGMLNGLDDIHESLELHVRAQELAGDLFGADASFYLVNGSTLSVQCAITAVAHAGVAIGMNLTDVADSKLETIRVVAE